jgi:hypothetical protein
MDGDHHIINTTEWKRAFLTEFMTDRAPADMSREDAIRFNFLFLHGDRDTGTLPIVESVAREVFGENWKRHVYIRIDNGQQYPYKLHGDKVAISDKVIFISRGREHANKWLEMYRASQIVRFVEPYEVLNLRQRILGIVQDIQAGRANVNDLIAPVMQIPAHLM